MPADFIEQASRCSQCGAPLSPRTLEGSCPRCTARLTFPFADDHAEAQDLQFGDYELIEELERGSMGVVYRARHRSLNRWVALKMILAGRFASQADVERFRVEAQAAASLQHPNIVAIHEIGIAEGRHYFTMDYVRGRSLADILRDSPVDVYDFRRSAGWILTVAEAIHYAHQHGILHRDLKPSNVLIDEHGQPRITDFGLAKRLDGGPDLTVSGKAIGTPSFMPPEQAVGQRAAMCPESDVYAIGALLYYLLTGRAPFASGTIEATLAQVLQQDPLPPRILNPGVPKDLETICLKCLEKDPPRRYRSAQELAADLRRFLAHEPISARPVRSPEKLWRWSRRNPSIAALSLGLMVTLVAGFVGVTWQWRRAEHHVQTEIRQRRLLEETLQHKEIEIAQALFEVADSASALARLARVLHRNPASQLAATRLLSALTFREFAIPIAPPFLHEAAVLSAQFSPDGHRVVTASADGSAAAWDARSGRRLVIVRHSASVRYAEFSPDGRRLVTGSEDGTARVWDAQSGEPVTPPLRHALKVRRVHFSPGGNRIVTASGDATARVWDAHSGQPLAPPLRHAAFVNEAVFSPDGLRVVTGADDNLACLWDSRTGERIGQPMKHAGFVWAVRFSPDGSRVVSASEDGTARIWDGISGTPLTPPMHHRELVHFACFSPDGTRVVTASWDDTARVWDAATGQPVTPPLRFESDVLFAEFSPDGKRVFTIADAAARVWNAESGTPVSDLLYHDAPLRHLGGFSPDGGRVVTTSMDKTAIVWDVDPGRAQPILLAGRQASRLITGSPDGRWLAATKGYEYAVHVWEASTGAIIAGPLEHGRSLATLQFSPGGERLLTACRDGLARIWDTRSGRLLLSSMSHGEALSSARFSPAADRVVTASEDWTARIWSGTNGAALTPPLQHRQYVRWAEFSPDGKRVATASGDSTARLWDADTGQPLGPPLRHELGLQSVRFSPDGRRLLTSSEDGTARMWEADTGLPFGRPLTHRGHVRWAEFSPNGNLVLTASRDRTARVWNALTTEPVTEPLKHPWGVETAHFSADSRCLVSVVGGDPIARIWDALTGHPLHEHFLHPDKVEAATFFPDGTRLATVSGDFGLRIWEVPHPPVPVPDWFIDLAEAVATKRLDDHGRSFPVSAAHLVQLRQTIQASAAQDYYSRWARWFFADRRTRTPSPHLPLPHSPALK